MLNPNLHTNANPIPASRIRFAIGPLTETQAQQICTWRYVVPYDLFNYKKWTQMVADHEEFGDPDIRREQYCGIVDQQKELCGYAQFFPLTGVTRLGFGLRPDLCGQGLGVDFVRTIVTEAQRRSPADEIDLEVLVWNERAIKTYLKSCFVATDLYERMTPTGSDYFYCMVYREPRTI